MKTNKLFSTQIQSFAHVLCNPLLRRGLHIIGQLHSLFDQTFLQALQRGRSQCLYEAQIQDKRVESVLAELPITPGAFVPTLPASTLLHRLSIASSLKTY